MWSPWGLVVSMRTFLGCGEVGMYPTQGSQLFCGSEQEFALERQAA